jgi:hypothetical protein
MLWRSLLGGSALCLAFHAPSAAQVQTTKTETSGEATKEVTIERGEIAYINGNSVVIKMEDGTFKHFDNVPDSVNFIVDGKPVNIHSAKVGMKLEKETVKTTTPRVVTTVETVTGTVLHVSPPSSVILRLENNETQQFKIPKNQKFTIDGQETDAWGLKKGMKISAQRVTEAPETVVAQQIQRSGVAPPPPPPPRSDVPLLIVVSQPTAPPVEAAAAAEPAPKKLPKTASDMPIIGLLGALLCGLSTMSIAIRKITSRSGSSGVANTPLHFPWS